MIGRFTELWRRLGATTDPETVFAALAGAYSQPRRFYHNLRHIESCLEEFDNVTQLAEVPDAVELAIWCHDAVYDPRASQNELQSADFASNLCSQADLPPDLIEKVHSLIIATAHDSVPAKTDERILVDVDLSILGKPTDQFDKYEQDIRAEYSFVPEELFRTERARILQDFLDRRTIYTTDYFVKKYESRARRNIERSLARLRER
ncbi:MAG: HD domain-containing protein [Planctomycetota bacterium]|jgi:predicted metal-dependent HD superfamily phosphohydrolase